MWSIEPMELDTFRGRGQSLSPQKPHIPRSKNSDYDAHRESGKTQGEIRADPSIIGSLGSQDMGMRCRETTSESGSQEPLFSALEWGRATQGVPRFPARLVEE